MAVPGHTYPAIALVSLWSFLFRQRERTQPGHRSSLELSKERSRSHPKWPSWATPTRIALLFGSFASGKRNNAAGHRSSLASSIGWEGSACRSGTPRLPGLGPACDYCRISNQAAPVYAATISRLSTLTMAMRRWARARMPMVPSATQRTATCALWTWAGDTLARTGAPG